MSQYGPLLCSTLPLNIVNDRYIDLARRADIENNIENFRFFFDFATGSRLVLSSIMRAEYALSDRGEDMRLEVAFHEGKASDMLAGEAAEEYLRMKRDDAESLQLLSKDPSGFLLLDNLIEKVKGDSDLHIGLHTKEYVLAGGEASRDLYKKLYGIADNLYPQK